MVMNGGVYLVVENNNQNALTPASGVPDLNLVSEDENNIVKWFLGNTLATGGNYTIPWSTTAGDNVRSMMVFPNAAAKGVTNPDFHVLASTYGTPASNLPLPSLVTHLTNLNLVGGGNLTTTFNDVNTVDRFWFLEMIDFATTPTPQLKFTVAPSEEPAGWNPNNLIIQRFNNGSLEWADWLHPAPRSLNASNTTNPALTIPTGEFYKSWTIASFDQPLSVELLSFNAECDNERATIRWSTASEQNSEYFTVESSSDGQFWETVEIVQAAGNSSSLIDYVVYDENVKNGLNYYKVTETDVNGVESEFGPISTSCGSDVFEIVNVNNDFENNSPLDVVINSSSDKSATIKIVDLTGKLVYSRTNTMIAEGISTISIDKNDLSFGVYFIAIQTADELLGRKVILN